VAFLGGKHATVLALALGAACGGRPTAPLRTLAIPEAGTMYHGVFPAGTHPDPRTSISVDALDGYEAAVGRKVAYIYFNHEWSYSRAFPMATVTWMRNRGSVPFIRLMMRSQKVPLVTDPVFTLDRILAGEFDGDLRAWADAAKRFGTPLIVEYGTEVNGDWNPWSAPYNGGHDIGPGKFRRAYRHIVELMRGRGASNITWALHYNGENYPGDDARNVPSAYYPGDDVVDWMGISAYGSERSNDRRCPSFRSLVDSALLELRAATVAKPLFIFEFASTHGNPGCPQTPWVTEALADLFGGRWPDIRGFSWWQESFTNDPLAGGFTDYLVQDNAAVASAFRSALTGPDAAKVLDRALFR
jgi:hypothetical protein